MGEVSETLTSRWQSGKHIGPATPTGRVEIRAGRFNKEFSPHIMLDGEPAIFAYFPLTPRHTPWHYYWTPAGDWKDLPNVGQIERDKDFDANGVQRVTLTLDNVVMVEHNGMSGLYHAVERGWLSPYRGYRPPNRPGTNVTSNEWYELLATNAQVRIFEGYGDEESCVFTGLLDDIELESFPDKITLTARDFGQTLTDQRFMGHVKDRHVKDPVIFADRRFADKVISEGGGATASGSKDGHPPRFALDSSKSTAWISDGHQGPNHTEWIQIKVPAGRYEDVYLESEYEGLEMWIAVYARPRSGVKGSEGGGAETTTLPVRIDNIPLDPDDDAAEGWLDLGGGTVPDTGATETVRHIASVTKRGRSYRLNHILELGDDSVFRLYFRKLKKDNALDRRYHAGVRRVQARKRRKTKEATDARWILVDDSVEVVKCCLRWAGFQEWEVENTGVRLTDKLIFNRSDFLIDAIKKIGELTNYTFFMADPSSDEDSRGVPTFRSNRAMQEPASVLLAITDRETLTGIKARFTDEPLARVIRVRGALADIDEGGRRDFVGSGADTWAAFQAFYVPPWARFDTHHRLGGLIKHVVHIDPFLQSQQECEISARFIAAAEALASATATIEIAGYPGVELDQQVYLLDTSTGLATRLWVASRSSSMQIGEETTYKMTLGGALLDTPDLVLIRQELDDLTRDSEDEEPIVVGAQH